ncbi:MAG: SDR family NAD(P)-dependent oxidoreductase [Promethearchaeota archaeon]|nr:MAG: SDR family NAD(P)-dependent oxidoreductase [Candidatus Lokiarchaeota archaeon]
MICMNEEKKAVVLGATGAIGSAIVRELAKKGKKVRAITRSEKKAKEMFAGMNVEIMEADVLNPKEAEKSVEGAEIVYHSIGIPYMKWTKLFPKIQANIIQAMKKSKGRLAYVDNLYMYGKMQGEKIVEDHPRAATSEKGKLRERLAQELLEKHKEEFPVVITRFPDFYGPNVVNGFSKPLFENPLKNKRASWTGSLDKKHSLIFIEDAAKAMIDIAENPDLYGEIWHVEGAEAVTGREFITMIYEQLGKEPKMRVLKKWVAKILGLFVPVVRELTELYDQWEYPFVIDGTKYRKINKNQQVTPHEEGIRKTLDWFEKQIDNE